MNDYCVYKHTSPSGKVYIGITCQKTYRRWGSRGQGYSGSKHFWKAIQKYGWENITHEILYTNLSEVDAKNMEIKLIEEYNSNDEQYGYNITSGGGGASGYKQSAEHIQKRMLKTSEKRRGKPLSDLHRLKIKNNNAKYWSGKPRSEETKRKISESLKGRRIPKEVIEKRTETYRKNHPPKEKPKSHYRKPVVQLNMHDETIVAIYPSAKEASLKTGASCQDIWSCMNGRQKTAKGFKWKYYVEENMCVQHTVN